MTLILPQRGRLSSSPRKAIEILSSLGLASGLSVCLDAGDSASYSSGYKWLDVSGNGQDWYRGTSASGDGAEPTFNGTPGGLSSSEYWSFDGGDYFSYDTSNETWMENLHKDNALHSIAFWFYQTGTYASVLATGANAGATAVGYYIFAYTGSTISVINRNGTSTAFSLSTSNSQTGSAWNFFGCSVDEAAGANSCVLNLNGTTTIGNATYSSPSSSAAPLNPMKICGDNFNYLTSGSRMAQFYAWGNKAIGAGALNSIFHQTRSRYGV